MVVILVAAIASAATPTVRAAGAANAGAGDVNALGDALRDREGGSASGRYLVARGSDDAADNGSPTRTVADTSTTTTTGSAGPATRGPVSGPTDPLLGTGTGGVDLHDLVATDGGLSGASSDAGIAAGIRPASLPSVPPAAAASAGPSVGPGGLSPLEIGLASAAILGALAAAIFAWRRRA